MGNILGKKKLWSNKPSKLIQPRSHIIHNTFKHNYYSEKCNKQLINHPVTNNVLLMQMSANMQALGKCAIVFQEVSMYLNLMAASLL